MTRCLRPENANEAIVPNDMTAMPTELHWLTIADAARLIESRKLSPVELRPHQAQFAEHFHVLSVMGAASRIAGSGEDAMWNWGFVTATRRGLREDKADYVSRCCDGI
jgi:hypothetical protein